MPKIHHFGIRCLRQLQRNWLKTNKHTNINKTSLSSHYLPKSKDIHFWASRWPSGKEFTKKWAKELTDISPKKTYRWLTNTWKDAQHHSLLEKCKSKLQWDFISHWSEWPSSKSLQAINAGEGVKKREPSYTVGGNANWYSYNGELWRVLQKLGIGLPYDPAIPVLGIHLEETRIQIKRHMYNNVHFRTIYNS